MIPLHACAPIEDLAAMLSGLYRIAVIENEKPIGHYWARMHLTQPTFSARMSIPSRPKPSAP